MKKLLCMALLVLLLCSLALPAAALEVSDDYDWTRFKNDKLTLYVYNWGEYISDGSDESSDVIAEFEALTGITVHYTTFASNEEMYAKIKSGGAQYDIILPSDYMIARMINEDMLEPIDFGNIPNYALVDDVYKHMEYDPDDAYSVPYMWGLVGLIYNTTMVEDDVTSWDALWDQRYMGNILMFSNSRDAFGIALLKLGYSLNTTDDGELAEAAQLLKDQKMLVQAYVMDEIFNKMEGGEAAVAPYYAGDALTMIDENPDLAFVYPEEGTNYFVDAMVIPSGCANKEAAEMFINFMCEPEVSAANAEYIGYSTPIGAAKELLDLDPETEAIAYPDESVMENTEVFKLLPEDTNTAMDKYWTEILSYNENQNLWIGPVFLVGALAASVVILIVRARKKNRSIY
ncbi:MAG: spermidine/putrescine ABC transporter substrate-binding protein [Oscillospiraceae bacterium]|nr:spermidine/putrescine ABC transporter substrate-binding protein [Oscillospiraceae bacterium]